MPTIRTLYKLEQYREALQKFAYKHALETLSKLPEQEKPKRIKHEGGYGTWYTEDCRTLTIKAAGPSISELEAYPYSFLFRLRTISVSYRSEKYEDGWHFDAEEKIYS